MKIAFDSQIFNLQEYGGISRYICSLVKSLSLYPDVEAKIIAPLHGNAYLPNLPPELVFGQKAPKIPKTGRLLRAANDFLARKQLDRFQPDIVHGTYYLPNVYAPVSARRVVTVYDMIHERLPSMFSARDRTAERKQAVVQRADHVICISEHTRRDLLEILDMPEDKVSVVYPGFDHLVESLEKAHAASELVGGKPYLLYVGYRSGHKNFSSMLAAFASSPMLREHFRVACFGGGAFRDEENKKFRELGLNQEKLVQLGGSDEKLAACYRGAAVFVYPSLYEGFGMPPLEAMSVDCPVVCSNTSSIAEVVGDAGQYFDPANIDSIRLALESVLSSTERQSELIKNGRARQSRFSWERTAKETLDIYRGLA